MRRPMTISPAVADAIDEEVLDEELMIDLSDVASDRDLARLAGRMDSLSRNKDFKRFLKEGPSEKEVSKEDEEKNFEPHMMYDPKSDRAEMANTYDDHVRLEKMGYVHKEEDDEGMSDDEMDMLMMERM